MAADGAVIAIELAVGGRPRRFAMRLPQGAGSGIPLVLVLHGNQPDAGGTRVVAWTVFGTGHTWPGSAPIPGYTQMTTQEFDAAEEICRFAQPLLAPATNRRR